MYEFNKNLCKTGLITIHRFTHIQEVEDGGPMHPHDTFCNLHFLIPGAFVNRIYFVPIKKIVPWGSF